MTYIDMILENIRDRFDLGQLDRFGIEEGADSVEVTAPNGVLLSITDTKRNFLSLHTAHMDNPDNWTFVVHGITTSEASSILTGFIAVNL